MTYGQNIGGQKWLLHHARHITSCSADADVSNDADVSTDADVGTDVPHLVTSPTPV